jgi:hypothetical protein
LGINKGKFPMTVDELKERLGLISMMGHGDDQIEAWDPDMESYQPVTVLTYGNGDQSVQIYTDEP